MSQPQKTAMPPKQPSTNQPPPVPTGVPSQAPPERKGCFDYFLSCFMMILLSLILLAALVFLAGFALEKLELRDDFFRAVEDRSGLKMPEKLKAVPTEQQEQNQEPSVETFDEKFTEAFDQRFNMKFGEAFDKRFDKKIREAIDQMHEKKPDAENPFVIE